MKMGAPIKNLDRVEILKFCKTPQPTKALCQKFNSSAGVIKRAVNELIEEKLLVKTAQKITTTTRWVYTTKKLSSKKIWQYIEPPYRAHDPFGLTIKRKVK